MKKTRGFTLIEAITTLAIIAITLSLVAPSFKGTIQNNRSVTMMNDLVSAINLARSEAIKRAGSVTVCASSNQTSCVTSSDWSTGWIVFSDIDSTGSVTTGDTLLRVWPTLDGKAVLHSTSHDAVIQYKSTGRISSTTAISFSLKVPDCTGNNVRNIQISTLGRVRQLSPTAC